MGASGGLDEAEWRETMSRSCTNALVIPRLDFAARRWALWVNAARHALAKAAGQRITAWRGPIGAAHAGAGRADLFDQRFLEICGLGPVERHSICRAACAALLAGIEAHATPHRCASARKALV